MVLTNTYILVFVMFEKGISISENFDELMQLAEKNPQEFDAFSQQLIEQVIDSVPQDRQLNMLRYQWRIDQEKRRHDNSMGCCIKLSAMMSERMIEMRKQLDFINGVSSEGFSRRFTELENAVVQLDMAQG
jgi:hypothetical protein